jgi:predicted GH43/DUF377 family glycosyl hydrolase
MHLSFRAIFAAAALLIALAILPLTPSRGAVHGQMVLGHGPEGSWDDRGVGRPSVVYSNSLFTMWYSGVGYEADTQNWYGIGRATSVDGVTWVRDVHNPVLKPGLAGEWDSSGFPERGGEAVISLPFGYKMWYDAVTIRGATLSIQIGYATSDDGINWQKYSDNPVLSPGTPGSFDDKWIFDPTVVWTGESYVMYYAALSQSGVRAAGSATSNDGAHWTKTGQIQLPATQTWDWGERHLSSVTKLGTTFAMAYDGSQQTGQPSSIGLGISNDGVSWAPYIENPVISPGESWSSKGVYEGVLVMVGSNYYAYFNGLNGDGTRIGLAILPISQYNVPEFELSTIVMMVAMLLGYVGANTRRFLAERHRTQRSSSAGVRS